MCYAAKGFNFKEDSGQLDIKGRVVFKILII